MKTRTRAISMFLAIMMALTLFMAPATASAAGTKYVTTATSVTVKTSSVPWYLSLFTKPTITVKNTGNTSATIIVYNSSYGIYSQVTTLKAGKSSTFKLKANSTYYVACSGHYTVGPSCKLTITSNAYVKSVS